MHSQPPKSPLSGGLGKIRGTLATSLSYGTRSVPTTINVHLFLEFTIVRFLALSFSSLSTHHEIRDMLPDDHSCHVGVGADAVGHY